MQTITFQAKPSNYNKTPSRKAPMIATKVYLCVFIKVVLKHGFKSMVLEPLGAKVAKKSLQAKQFGY